MAEVCIGADTESSPARIWNPAMFLCQSFFQQCIMDWPSEWYVNISTDVNMADFCASKSKFSSTKSVEMSRYVGPSQNFFFECLLVIHFFQLHRLLFG